MATCSRPGRPSTCRRGAVSCTDLLDRVVLRRGDGRGKGGAPLAERTQIVLRGNVLLEPDGSDPSS